MEMEDPWGSPWADEIQHPPTATKENGDDYVTPSSPARASRLGLEEKTSSLWDDEAGAFEEWAAVPGDEENQLGFEVAGGAWKSPDSEDNALTKENSTELSQHWNDTTPIPTCAIPKLAPSLMPKSGEIARKLSEDPWAAETAANGGSYKEDNTKLETCQQEMKVRDGTFSRDDQQSSSMDYVDDNLKLAPQAQEIVSERTGGDEKGAGDAMSDGRKVMTEPHEEVATAHEVDHESSRPSSSPSDRSHHDEVLSESPRTSLDEESKRPPMPRLISSKIHVLVQHFDGLAKKDVAMTVQSNRSRSATPSGQTERAMEEPEAEEDEFGDFEDGQSEAENSMRGDETPLSSIIVAPHSPDSSIPETPEAPGPQDIPSPRRSSREDYGRVVFQVDESALGRLYPLAREQTPPATPIEKFFVPDMIPFDSFSSTEERKIWYRISRYGSMKKHNSGDDENYIRVNWAQSQIRSETLKIVARWMEEDRISGRVVLGGGSKGSSIFGWNDPNAAPVPLASAFAAKRGTKTPATQAIVQTSSEIPRESPKGSVQTQSTSNGGSLPKGERRRSTKSVSTADDIEPGPHLRVANFGWNIVPKGDQESKIKIPILPSKPVQKASPTNVNPPSPSSSTIGPFSLPQPRKPTGSKGMNTPLPPTNTSPRQAQDLSSISNDDADWGEMVSSPITTSPPVLPPTSGLPEKGSWNLVESFSPPMTTSPETTILAIQRRQGHGPTMDSEIIPLTKPTSSPISSPDSFPSNTLTTDITRPIVDQLDPIASQEAPPAISDIDPWAVADFSFFDSAPAPELKSALGPVSKPIPPKPFSFRKPAVAPSPLRKGKSRQEIEQDQIVASILNSLPDLSYMLRR